MPTTKLTVDLDSGLHAKAREAAARQERSLEDLVIALLTDLVKEDRRRWATRELYKPYVERPTLALGGIGSQPPRDRDDSEE
ncbi:MAG: hypothetical protein K0U98_09545 [Deltaproteobacteria bacterium]|nr:hypothetical protein [Deltaproteobacteria bacterium]